MGHIRTPKFELRLELRNSSNVECIGVNSLHEAGTKIIENQHRSNLSGKAFLWGNSQAGKNYIQKKGCDFLKLDNQGKFVPAFCS